MRSLGRLVGRMRQELLGGLRGDAATGTPPEEENQNRGMGSPEGPRVIARRTTTTVVEEVQIIDTEDR